MKKLACAIGLWFLLGATGFAEYEAVFPENTGYIFDREEAGFTVTADGAQNIAVRCTADGETIIDDTLTGDGQFFSLSALCYGKHKLLIEVLAGDVVEYSLSQEITVIKKHQPQLYDALSRVGVVQHRGQSAVQDSERLELMNTAGVKWARDLLSWWSYETDENVWNDSYGDKVCKAYSENGTKLHLTLCHYNDLYNAEGEKGYAPHTEAQLAKFAEYVRQVVTNYPDIKEFEIYNEPNRDATWMPESDVVAYCNLVKCASRIIRELRPDARIVAGAVSNTRNTVSSGTKGASKGDGIRFLREMAQQGIFAYVDAISAHPYTYTNYSDARYADFLDLYENVRDYDGWYGWKDFQITETGFPVMEQYGITEQLAAENIVKSFVYGDRVGAEKVFIYEFVSSGADSSNREHQFGILCYDRSARLAYPALVQYCNTVSGADYLGEMQLGGAEVYLYQKEGSVLAVLWSASGEDVTFAQETAVSCFDLYGNALSAENNTVAVGTAPVYVTGIDKSYAVQAVEGVYSGLGISMPDLSQGIAAAVDNNYKLAYSDDGLDDGEKMLLYSKVHRAGVALAALYPVFERGTVQLSRDTITAAREKINGELPFADSIMRQAEKYYSLSQELAAFSETNPAVYSKYMIAINLCRLAEYCAEWEKPDYQNSIAFSVTPTKVKSGGRNTVSGNITNIGGNALSFDLAVYDNQGNAVSDTVSLSLATGAKADIELGFTVSENLPGGRYFYELRAVREGQVLSRQSILADIESSGPIDAVSPSEVRELSDENYCFSVDGKRFLVLDDSGEKYFVMALDDYGTATFSTEGTQKFDPENPASIAVYVNNITFPDGITAHIDKNHIWRTEAGYLGGDIPNDYDVECAVSLLSHTEMMRYADRIGWNDIGQSWWLRTVRGANSWWDKGLCVNWNKGRIIEHTLTSRAAVRPVFWLHNEFFDTVKLDSLGAGIAEYMNCGQFMVNGVYTAEELAALGISSDVYRDIKIENNTVSYTLKDGVNAVVYAAVYDGDTLCSVAVLEENESRFVEIKKGQKMKLIVTETDRTTPASKAITYKGDI